MDKTRYHAQTLIWSFGGSQALKIQNKRQSSTNNHKVLILNQLFSHLFSFNTQHWHMPSHNSALRGHKSTRQPSVKTQLHRRRRQPRPVDWEPQRLLERLRSELYCLGFGVSDVLKVVQNKDYTLKIEKQLNESKWNKWNLTKVGRWKINRAHSEIQERNTGDSHVLNGKIVNHQ